MVVFTATIARMLAFKLCRFAAIFLFRVFASAHFKLSVIIGTLTRFSFLPCDKRSSFLRLAIIVLAKFAMLRSFFFHISVFKFEMLVNLLELFGYFLVTVLFGIRLCGSKPATIINELFAFDAHNGIFQSSFDAIFPTFSEVEENIVRNRLEILCRDNALAKFRLVYFTPRLFRHRVFGLINFKSGFRANIIFREIFNDFGFDNYIFVLHFDLLLSLRFLFRGLRFCSISRFIFIRPESLFVSERKSCFLRHKRLCVEIFKNRKMCSGNTLKHLFAILTSKNRRSVKRKIKNI